MLLFVLILAGSNIAVHSRLCTGSAYQPGTGPYNQYIFKRDPYESPPILPCEGVFFPQTFKPNIVTAVPDTTMYVQQTIVPDIAVPVATTVKTMPVIPFITELPNCPDICFNEILTSPLGCLDPILTIYGTKDVCPLPELPVSPLLPATSALSSPNARLLPPVFDCEYNGNFLKRVSIPPPFI